MCELGYTAPRITVSLTIDEARRIINSQTADPIAYRAFRRKVKAKVEAHDRPSQPPKSAQEVAYDLARGTH
jgi:hypothetical protein